MSTYSANLFVLVVEDEWVLRQEIVDEMRRIGWTVLEAGSGQGALVLLRPDQKIDVLVTDVRLTGILNGWDIAKAFRAARPDMPIVYTSANPVIESQQVSGSVFLSKPCRTSEIIEVCRELCRSK